jgi:hypothetical protein
MLLPSVPGRAIQAAFASSFDFVFAARAIEIATQPFTYKTNRILSPSALAGQQLPYASASASKNLTHIVNPELSSFEVAKSGWRSSNRFAAFVRTGWAEPWARAPHDRFPAPRC